MVKVSKSIHVIVMIAIFFWASAFVGIRAGLQDYSPVGLALLRYIVASATMAIIYFRLPERQALPWKEKIALLVIGALGIGGYNLALNYGELTVPSGMASFVVAQSPIFTALLAMMFLGESLTLMRMLGFLVSVGGVALITMGQDGGFQWSSGLSYITLAAFAGAFYTTVQKPYLAKYHTIQVTTYMIWGGTLVMCVFAPQLPNEVSHASLYATMMVVYLGIFPAALGYLAWAYVLAKIPASRAGSYLYFMPFMATLIGWVYLGEVPVVLSLIGGMLAIFGVWLVNKSYATPKVKAVEISPTPASETVI